MKKIVSSLLVCVMLVGMIFTLASCGKSLSGKYEADWGVAEYTYEFGAFGKVTLTVDPIVGDDSVYEGKYEINKAEDEITFTFEDEDAKEYNGTKDLVIGTESGVDYIKIDGIKYEKVD